MPIGPMDPLWSLAQVPPPELATRVLKAIAMLSYRNRILLATHASFKYLLLHIQDETICQLSLICGNAPSLQLL